MDTGTSVSVAFSLSDMLIMCRLERGCFLSASLLCLMCFQVHVPSQGFCGTLVECLRYIGKIDVLEIVQAAERRQITIRGADNAWQQPHA